MVVEPILGGAWVRSVAAESQGLRMASDLTRAKNVEVLLHGEVDHPGAEFDHRPTRELHSGQVPVHLVGWSLRGNSAAGSPME